MRLGNLSKAPKPTNSFLYDEPIGEMQDIFSAQLDWLDYAFGKAFSMQTRVNGTTTILPAVFIPGYEYFSLSPNDNLGNYCFFKLADSQEFELVQDIMERSTSDVDIIFWFNINQVTTDSGENNTEEIKKELVTTIAEKIKLRTGSFIMESITEGSAEDVFTGYTYNDFEEQFLMYPYYGFKISGSLLLLPDQRTPTP